MSWPTVIHRFLPGPLPLSAHSWGGVCHLHAALVGSPREGRPSRLKPQPDCGDFLLLRKQPIPTFFWSQESKFKDYLDNQNSIWRVTSPVRVEYGLVSWTFLVPIKPLYIGDLGSYPSLVFSLVLRAPAVVRCPHFAPHFNNVASTLGPLWADAFPLLSTHLENKTLPLRFISI